MEDSLYGDVEVSDGHVWRKMSGGLVVLNTRSRDASSHPPLRLMLARMMTITEQTGGNRTGTTPLQ